MHDIMINEPISEIEIEHYEFLIGLGTISLEESTGDEPYTLSHDPINGADFNRFVELGDVEEAVTAYLIEFGITRDNMPGIYSDLLAYVDVFDRRERYALLLLELEESYQVEFLSDKGIELSARIGRINDIISNLNNVMKVFDHSIKNGGKSFFDIARELSWIKRAIKGDYFALKPSIEQKKTGFNR